MTVVIHEVFPYLRLRGAARAIEFYTEAFGAEEQFRLTEPSGRIGHAELKLGPATIMISDEYPEYDLGGPETVGGTTFSLHVHVDNVDELYARAVAAGATAVREPSDAFYGERGGTVRAQPERNALDSPKKKREHDDPRAGDEREVLAAHSKNVRQSRSRERHRSVFGHRRSIARRERGHQRSAILRQRPLDALMDPNTKTLDPLRRPRGGRAFHQHAIPRVARPGQPVAGERGARRPRNLTWEGGAGRNPHARTEPDTVARFAADGSLALCMKEAQPQSALRLVQRFEARRRRTDGVDDEHVAVRTALRASDDTLDDLQLQRTTGVSGHGLARGRPQRFREDTR